MDLVQDLHEHTIRLDRKIMPDRHRGHGERIPWNRRGKRQRDIRTLFRPIEILNPQVLTLYPLSRVAHRHKLIRLGHVHLDDIDFVLHRDHRGHRVVSDCQPGNAVGHIRARGR